MKKNLFIIGNGFDLHHGLKTTYGDFYNYLKLNDTYNFNVTSNLFLSQKSEKDLLWNDFEGSLSAFDFHAFNFLDEYENSRLVKYSSLKDIKLIFESWKLRLEKNFKSWLKTNTQNVKSMNRRFNGNDIFLNFNYTKTLQDIYKINENNILHIHNNIDNNKLIFGHANNYDVLDVFNNYGLIQDGYIKCSESQFIDAGIIVEIGNSLKKNVDEIIKRNSNFFTSNANIENIVVLGHSLNKIDIPYFRYIIDNCCIHGSWYFSYYNEKDIENINLFIKQVNISNYKIEKLQNIINDFTNPYNK